MRKLFSIVGGLSGEVGGVALPARQPADLGFQVAVDALGRPGQLDEPVSFDRRGAVNGALGFGDLLINAAQGALGPVMAVLVMNRPVGDPAGLLTTAGRPRLSQHQTVRDGLAGVVVAPFAHHIGQERNPGRPG